MVKRMLTALLILFVFVCVSMYTPVHKIVFSVDGKEVNPFEKINYIQITETKADVKEIIKNKEKESYSVSKPIHLEIPSLQEDAPIMEVGLTDSGAMDVVDNASTISWYKYGAIPGQSGNAILAGHSDWGNKIGTLFYLEEMKKGDELIITFEDNHKQIFYLDSLNVYHMDEVPREVMNIGGKPRVTLITCTGEFNRELGSSEHRVVAIFHKK